ncbi:unnamed protein product [Triticum turgidum subsp. durum]|uniref:Beta-Casp domain-containing protein n=1 Tax=Triticum turgidum subsp. durum TaxID=4567 RepID=A0A9R0W334_TRITD|nr:unnamed protein product [Triticum turgidum subsp. durum]
MLITPLGGGSEVGRSCVHLSFKGRKVLVSIPETLASPCPLLCSRLSGESDPLRALQFDCGIHPAYLGMASLPFFDEIDPAAVDVIDFHQTLQVNGIRFWCYTAGHVLGAAMFMVDIAGVRILYTGDYSREEDRHLKAAEIPQFSPDICIIESTYGGRVLIPAFALGRAQELLLILDEYWSNHPELHKIPIYYASPLAKNCMAVYQTYINSMNDRIRNQFARSNPFHFKHIDPLNSTRKHARALQRG